MKLLRKGVFPCDYMDENWENKLKEKKLRDIKHFHSILNNRECSDDDYNHARETFNYFGCKEITDYIDLYVKTDVLSLANVFIACRKEMYKIYGSNPLYCISVPGFFNRAMLKMTNVEIKLITNIDMHLMIENGIRGGWSEPICYHSKASDKYINANFNSQKESWIIGLDANSLYASAMCYELQHGEIKIDHNISKHTNEYILNWNP